MDSSTQQLAETVAQLIERVSKLERLDRPTPTVLPGASCAILTKSATQQINPTDDVAITFNGEVIDTDNYHNNSTNTSRLTAPADGYYLVGGSVVLDSLTDLKYLQLSIRKNGAAANGDGKTLIQQSAATSTTIGVAFMRVVPMSAGDYVELIALNNKSTQPNAQTSSNGTSFWIFKVG